MINLFAVFWMVLAMLMISAGIIRQILITKAYKDERRREEQSQRKEEYNFGDNSKPK